MENKNIDKEYIYKNIERMEEREMDNIIKRMRNIREKREEIMGYIIRGGEIKIGREKEEIEELFKKIGVISGRNRLGDEEWRIIEIGDKIIMNNSITKYHYKERKNREIIEDIKRILERSGIEYEYMEKRNSRYYKSININYIIKKSGLVHH